MNCVLPEPPRPMCTNMMSGGDCLARDSAVTASPALVTRYPSPSSRRAFCVLVVGSSSTNKAVVGLVALAELIVHLLFRGTSGAVRAKDGCRSWLARRKKLCPTRRLDGSRLSPGTYPRIPPLRENCCGAVLIYSLSIALARYQCPRLRSSCSRQRHTSGRC